MPSRLSSRLKLGLGLAAVMAIIIVPFLVWGAELDRLAPELLTGSDSRLLVAGVGAMLLAIDVALPIPSSVVSAMLCLLAGPLLGAAAILIGMLGSFVCGYSVGRLVPRDSLRRWVGADLWDSVSDRAAHSGNIWIMASRPVPVLAEATSIISGSLGVPFRPALFAALVSSAGVACCYGTAAIVGLSSGGFWLAFGTSVLLACLLWVLSRTWRTRISAPITSSRGRVVQSEKMR